MKSLPIDPLLPTIVEALKKYKNMIITASPGAGKTTRLPPELLSVVKGKVVVLEPRRMATVSACHRIAEEREWTVGQQVGYQVRFENKSSRDTRLLFMTDALLLRKMVDDPELKNIDLVVLDEFHERNLNQDLILGALRELQELGRDIKILIMSATLDAAHLQEYLPDVHHIDVAGKVYPLEVRYSAQPFHYQTDRSFYDRVANAIKQATKETDGDILVFLPGTGEIRRVQEQLSSIAREVVPLHGSLSLDEQRKVLSASTSARIVLSTNVAEASVTVQGVNYVIDTGLAKVMSMNPHSGFSALELSRISLFNAKQRSGRAAREREGISLRLWTANEEKTLPQQLVPEINRADLTSALLWLANFGVRDFTNFSWLDAPSAATLTVATTALQRMGALSVDNEITTRGKRLMNFPLPPRLGMILLEAEDMGECQLGAKVAAILSERNFYSPDTTTHTECDVTDQLDRLNEKSRGTEVLRQTAQQLESLMKGSKGSETDPRILLMRSQKDRLCRRREKSARGLMVGGRGVKLDPRSQVRESGFFLALAGVDLADQSESLVSVACGLSKAQVLKAYTDEIKIEESIQFVEDKESFFLSRARSFYGLPIDEPTLKPVSAEEVKDRWAEILIPQWEWLSKQNEALGLWLARWNFLCRHLPEYKDQLGQQQIAQALTMACYGKTDLRSVISENLVHFIEMELPPETVRVLKEQVPAHFTAPSGVSHRIEYGEAPYVHIRLQEIFGLLKTPLILFDKVALTFSLLGPNFRPVQITSDLQNFWRKAYIEVRKELRSRYPKHSWPEDPLTAKPEAKGRRRQ